MYTLENMKEGYIEEFKRLQVQFGMLFPNEQAAIAPAYAKSAEFFLTMIELCDRLIRRSNYGPR